MPDLRVTVMAFTDRSTPGWVDCTFRDALGELHTFNEKLPIVSRGEVGFDSQLPHAGTIACEIVRSWRDDMGNQLYAITTEHPYGVSDTGGQSRFVVRREHLAGLL